MTGVVQLIVPKGRTNFHLSWAALATAIIALGPARPGRLKRLRGKD